MKVPANWWKTLTLSGLFAGAQKLAESYASPGGGDTSVMIASGAVAAGLVGNYLVNRASSQAEAEEDEAQRAALKQRNHHLRRGMSGALCRALAQTQSAEARRLPEAPYTALFAHWERQLSLAATDDAALEYVFPAEHAESQWEAANSYSPNDAEDAAALAQLLRERLTPTPELYQTWTAEQAGEFARRALPYYRQAFAEEVVGDSGGPLMGAFLVKGISDGLTINRQVLAIVQQIRDRQAAPAFPAQPRLPIWHIRRQRNPHLTGRDELRRQLRQNLEAQRGAVLTQAIAGLGGVGKTTLATDYAYEYAAEYDVVWEVPCEDSAVARGALADLAVRLGVEPDASSNPQAWESAREWLERHGRWLLIWDNAVSYDSIRDLLPRAGNRGHVLITSRNPNWRAAGIEALSLPTLSPEEGAWFLLARTGREGEEEEARAVSVELGGLPLALEIAAAYVEENPMPWSRYRAKLGTPAMRRLIEPVARNLEISIEKLPEGAVWLLERLAFLAPDAIPRQFVEGWDPEADLDEAIGALRRYSLVTVVEPGDGSLAVHRLLQRVVRARLGDHRAAEVCGEVLRQVNGRFGYDHDKLETWEPAGQLYEHAVAAALHAADLGVEADRTSSLLDQAGAMALYRRADLAAALRLLQQALAIDEKSFGPDHPNVAMRANNIGHILQAQGDLGGALTSTRRALAINEKSYGPDHPTVGTLANNIGTILKDQGDLDGALSYTLRALAIDEKSFGPDHPNVARVANNIGQILQARGELDGALIHARRALAITEKSYEPDHPNVAICANNIGHILQAQGDLDGALTHTRHALAIDEKIHGPEHPNVAIRANNIGQILQAQGDLDGALSYARRALAIWAKFLGLDHPNTRRAAANLTGIEQQMRR